MSYRNDGGRFIDVTDEAGIVDREGRGLAVLAADLDEDGLVDIYVANDLTANLFYKNLGGFRFREIGAEAGLATNAEGGYLAGMGIACGDLDGDGRFDLAVTNFYGQMTTFYQNLGADQFIDRTIEIGLGPPSRYMLGFGIAFLDVNNDGRLDLATGQRSRQRPPPSRPLRHARAALPGRRERPAARRLGAGRAALERAAHRPRPGHGRPRQRRQDRPPDRPDGRARWPISTTRGRPGTS